MYAICSINGGNNKATGMISIWCRISANMTIWPVGGVGMHAIARDTLVLIVHHAAPILLSARVLDIRAFSSVNGPIMAEGEDW